MGIKAIVLFYHFNKVFAGNFHAAKVKKILSQFTNSNIFAVLKKKP